MSTRVPTEAETPAESIQPTTPAALPVERRVIHLANGGKSSHRLGPRVIEEAHRLYPDAIIVVDSPSSPRT